MRKTRKFLIGLLSAVMLGATAFGFAACSKDEEVSIPMQNSGLESSIPITSQPEASTPESVEWESSIADSMETESSDVNSESGDNTSETDSSDVNSESGDNTSETDSSKNVYLRLRRDVYGRNSCAWSRQRATQCTSRNVYNNRLERIRRL